ncbi:hypothetical protein RYX36_000943, partial [Vicia faba]
QKKFASAQVSYETFLMHSSKFNGTGSGTPLHIDLEEFFAVVNFIDPRVLGPIAHFRCYFEGSVIWNRTYCYCRREETQCRTQMRYYQIILPSKIVKVVCCRLTLLQSDLYKNFIHSKVIKRELQVLKSVFNSSLQICHVEGLDPGQEIMEAGLSFLTLDLFAQLRREQRYPHLMLDGATPIIKRYQQKKNQKSEVISQLNKTTEILENRTSKKLQLTRKNSPSFESSLHYLQSSVVYKIIIFIHHSRLHDFLQFHTHLQFFLSLSLSFVFSTASCYTNHHNRTEEKGMNHHSFTEGESKSETEA